MSKKIRSKSKWLERVALLGWGLLALSVIITSPEPVPPSPFVAERLYKEARSMRSSAPGGILAFAEVLKRLGFAVQPHFNLAPPNSTGSTLFILLAPAVHLEPIEEQQILKWIEAGGVLIYAAKKDDQRDPFPEFLHHAAHKKKVHTNIGFLELGQGQALLLSDGGKALSNAVLKEEGLAAVLPWLEPLLANTTKILFDEGRTTLSFKESVVELLQHSAFWPAVQLGLLALLLWLVARLVRENPAQEPGPIGSRDFGEHLDAVGALLFKSQRIRLAQNALLQGSRHRLGARLKNPELAAKWKQLNQPIVSVKELGQLAKELQLLEKN